LAIRPRIQRAFFAWLEEARARLKRQVIPGKRTDRVLEFSFDVGGRALLGWLSHNGISVGAFDGDHWYDFVYDDDIVPERVPNGVICRLCLPEAQRTFATREELWREHLFEPFLAWMNEKLAPATALALFSTEPDPERGATWPKLVRSPDQAAGATKLVPFAASYHGT
jgi:hypothetical protein